MAVPPIPSLSASQLSTLAAHGEELTAGVVRIAREHAGDLRGTVEVSA